MAKKSKKAKDLEDVEESKEGEESKEVEETTGDPTHASGGHRAEARIRLGGSLALP